MKQNSLYLLTLLLLICSTLGQEILVNNAKLIKGKSYPSIKFNKPEWNENLDFAFYGWVDFSQEFWNLALIYRLSQIEAGKSQLFERVMTLQVIQTISGGKDLIFTTTDILTNIPYNESIVNLSREETLQPVFIYQGYNSKLKKIFVYVYVNEKVSYKGEILNMNHVKSKYYEVFINPDNEFTGQLFCLKLASGEKAYRETDFQAIMSKECKTDIPTPICNKNQYISKNICMDCKKECKTCVDGSSCSSCQEGFVLKGSVCEIIPTCNQNQYLSNNTCIDCKKGCNSCSDGQSCTSCKIGYVQIGKVCEIIPTCNQKQYLSNNTCIDCKTECKTCADSLSCSSCQDGFVLKGNVCEVIPTCKQNQYLENNKCIDCKKECKTCVNGQECTSCNDGFVQTQNICSPIVKSEEILVQNVHLTKEKSLPSQKFTKPEWNEILDFAIYGWIDFSEEFWSLATVYRMSQTSKTYGDNNMFDRVLALQVIQTISGGKDLAFTTYDVTTNNPYNETVIKLSKEETQKAAFVYQGYSSTLKKLFVYVYINEQKSYKVEIPNMTHSASKFYEVFINPQQQFDGQVSCLKLSSGETAYRENNFEAIMNKEC